MFALRSEASNDLNALKFEYLIYVRGKTHYQKQVLGINVVLFNRTHIIM